MKGGIQSLSTVTVLLRSLVRICGAQAALVVCDGAHGAHAACGLSAEAALDAAASVASGSTLPGGLHIAWALPIRFSDAQGATVFVLDRTSPAGEPILTRTVEILAAEIGRELEAQARSARDSGRPAAAELVAQIATGIDALNDAAAIIEWPRVGSEPRILHVNGAFESVLGFAAEAAVGRTLQFLYGPLTDLGRAEFMNERVRATLQARIPIVYYRLDGAPIWVEVSLRGFAATSQNAACMVATLRDVSARKEFEFALAKEKRKLQITLAAIGDGVITTVGDGRIDYVNLAAQEMFGIDAAEAYGQPLGGVLRLSDAGGERIDMLAAVDGAAGVNRGQAQFDGHSSVKHVAYVSSPIGEQGYVLVLRDVTAQQRLSTQLSYEASHDSLTNTFNRRKFDQLLEDAIDSARRDDGPHALAFLDLDRFKSINDRCGHTVGDRVLLDLANLLQGQLRGRDVLARIGGDEFAVLLHDCTPANARRVLEKLRRAVDNYRVSFGGHEYSVGVSIGITPIDGSERDAGALFARADAACYAAKSSGRNAVAG